MIARLRKWLQQGRIDKMEIRLARLLAEEAQEMKNLRLSGKFRPAILSRLAGAIAETRKILELLSKDL